MEAVKDIGAFQLADLGWDETIYDPMIDSTSCSLHDDPEPSARTNDPAWNTSSEAQTAPHTIPLRAKIIPKADWERFRPIIEELYVVQGLKLSTVREIMARDHGFDAAEPMYKKRFAAWKSRKNYTKEQKEEVLRHLQMGESGDIVASITINKKPLKSSRLRRPVQQNGRPILLAHQSLHRGQANRNWASYNGRTSMMLGNSSAARMQGLSVLPNDILMVRELASSPGLLPRIQLQQSPESQRIEQILRLAQIYWSSYANRPASQRDYGFGEELIDVFNNFAIARYFLAVNDCRAFVMLNKACSGARALFRAQPFRLFDLIILEFSHPRWAMNWQIKLALLRYLHSMARCSLGSEHPVSKTVTHLAVDGDTTELTSKFGRLCIDTVNGTLVDSNEDDAMSIQYDVLNFLEQSGNLDDVERICQQIDKLLQKRVLRAKQKYARTHLAVRMTLKSLGWLRYQQNDLKSAEELLLETVETTTHATGLPNGDYTGISVCGHLGMVYRALGNWSESAKYFSLAIDGGIRLWGEDDTDVLDYVRLELVLEESGLEEQLEQLRERWKGVWERLENELKGSSPVVSSSS